MTASDIWSATTNMLLAGAPIMFLFYSIVCAHELVGLLHRAVGMRRRKDW